MIFSYFQHFLGKNQVVKGMLVVKEGRLTVLLHFPKFLRSQIFKNFWEYICGSSQNVKNVFCQEKTRNFSWICQIYWWRSLFLVKLNSLTARDFIYKNKLFCRYFLRFFYIVEYLFVKHLFSCRIHLIEMDYLSYKYA